MKNERIVCFGRPIIDITGRIRRNDVVIVRDKLRDFIIKGSIEDLLKDLSKSDVGIFVSAGGVEANVAINCAFLDLPSLLIGTIGSDYFKILPALTFDVVKNLDMRLRVVSDFNSAVVVVILNRDRKQILKLFEYGASNYCFWNRQTEEYLKEATVFFTSLFTANSSIIEETWKKSIKSAVSLHKKVVISLGGIDTLSQEKLEEIISFVKTYASMVFMNREEYRILKGIISGDVASNIFPNAEFVVITNNREGSCIFDKRKRISIQPSVRLSVEQSYEIGAGDAFCAGFIFALLKGFNSKEAGEFASEVSLIKIKQPNSHLAINDLVELGKLKSKYFS